MRGGDDESPPEWLPLSLGFPPFASPSPAEIRMRDEFVLMMTTTS